MPVQNQQAKTSQKTIQKQVVTQKLIQSVKMMAMPLSELRETIFDEVEKNPALEVIREATEIDIPVVDNSLGDTELSDDYSEIIHTKTGTKDSDSRQRYLEGAISRESSLLEYLINQLHLLKIESQLVEIAEILIGNLDKDGFNREDLSILKGKWDSGKFDAACQIIQKLDPIGCCCDNWKHSLLVQSNIRGDAPENYDVFVNKAFPLMEKYSQHEICKMLKISKDDWQDMEDYTRTLNPYPGRIFSNEIPQYIIPDVVVRKDKDGYTLELNDEVIPVIQVNTEFEKLKESPDLENDTDRFITSHCQEARYFINSLIQREKTLLKVSTTIVDFQRDFFLKGPRFLKPLTMKEVADEIGVHEATVSRITTGKYMQTDWGILDLKYFFTNSISGTGSSGSQVSRVAAKEIIKEILMEAGSNTRMTDQKLCDLLANRGVNLARRTVAKYRKELDLPSSYNR